MLRGHVHADDDSYGHAKILPQSTQSAFCRILPARRAHRRRRQTRPRIPPPRIPPATINPPAPAPAAYMIPPTAAFEPIGALFSPLGSLHSHQRSRRHLRLCGFQARASVLIFLDKTIMSLVFII